MAYSNFIVLSAGHTPKSPGAVFGNLREHDLNMTLLLALRGALEAMEYSVVCLDPLMTLGDKIRVLKAQEYKNTLLKLEIHHNAFNGKAQGAEIFYPMGDTNGYSLASKLLKNTCRDLGLKNRGVKLASSSARGSLGWLRTPNSLLWEVCFMDNPSDLSLVTPDAWATSVSLALQRHLRPK